MMQWNKSFEGCVNQMKLEIIKALYEDGKSEREFLLENGIEVENEYGELSIACDYRFVKSVIKGIEKVHEVGGTELQCQLTMEEMRKKFPDAELSIVYLPKKRLVYDEARKRIKEDPAFQPIIHAELRDMYIAIVKGCLEKTSFIKTYNLLSKLIDQYAIAPQEVGIDKTDWK